MAEIGTAMVMAAGLGTRIRALSGDLPKPLVSVGACALIDYALDELSAAGAARAVVNVHYKADELEAHVGGRRAPEVVVSDERAELMNTGGALVHAAEALGREPVFVTNTDAILRHPDGVGASARALAEAWDASAMDGLMLLVRRKDATGYAGEGDLALGPGGRVSWEGEDRLIYTGLQILHPRLWAGAPHEPLSTKLFWDDALSRGRLYGVVHEGTWMHVGDPEGHAEAEARLR